MVAHPTWVAWAAWASNFELAALKAQKWARTTRFGPIFNAPVGWCGGALMRWCAVVAKWIRAP